MSVSSWNFRAAGRGSLLLACSGFAICAGLGAQAANLKSCQTPSSTGDVSCTIDAGEAVDGAHVDFTGADSSDEDDRGASGGTYTLTNKADITVGGTQNDILFLRLNGGRGYDNSGGDGSRGGDGGTVTLDNQGDIALQGTAGSGGSGGDDGSLPGVGDDEGRVTAIYLGGYGGAGGDAEDGVGGGDGGDGGIAGEGALTNSGDVTLWMDLPWGGAAIYAAMVSGAGGSQDDTAGDQDGGTAGDGRTLTVDNSGSVRVTADSASKFVWGIAAESIGGTGGNWNGNGGQGGAITLTHTGDVTVTAEGSDLTLGVRGIYLASVGGPGSIQGSSDASDDGGRGEEGLPLTATISGDVTVTSHSLTAPDDSFVATATPEDDITTVGALQQSGGVVLYSRGGDGGAGPQAVGSSDRAGGAGGGGSSLDQGVNGTTTLLLNNAAQVTTVGDWLPGVAVLSVGGVGGIGREDSSGANGGYGGNVTVQMYDGAGISTDGDRSAGLVLRSVGGPGGDFQPSSGFVDFTPALAGTGGAGGAVLLQLGIYFENDGSSGDVTGPVSIATTGTDSSGVVLQSIGSAGGKTGDSFQLLGQEGDSTGYGGAGGRVGGNFQATIATQQDGSRGMLLQSIGGDAGEAGEESGLYVVGGAGGSGGNGGEVWGVFLTDIATQGDSAAAIQAQSIGGGGGTAEAVGGVNVVGGQGGSGGSGDTVDLSIETGTLTTAGEFSYGVLAQSVGGGGGDGGASFDLSVGVPPSGVGGNGGVGGGGGAVTLNNVGLGGAFIPGAPLPVVVTGGDNAHGVIAQSIGGGGGAGGNADGGGASIDSMQIAGGAQSGGNGGATTIDFIGGWVTTTGSHAIGLLSQSVGGGGGSGGSAFSFDASLGFALSVGVGGAGGNGGKGGAAAVDLADMTVATGSASGTDAHGVVVQSVGGGGGVGGSSVSKAIARSVSIPDTDVSVGFSAAAAIGGKGGSGGDGGTATAQLSGTAIATQGDGAMGLVAQSVGGGGGMGGSASSTAGVTGDEASITATVSAALGAAGGSGGYGGTVSVDLDGSSSIETHGDHAAAILAQSIGGGGGAGGIGSASVSQTGDGYSFTGTIGLGASGGQGQQGGAVDVALAQGSRIVTHGSGSRGLLAQSVGGGGGASQGGTIGVAASGGEDGSSGSLDVSVGQTGASGSGGKALTTSTKGSIVTYGDDADGALIQSIGGGGGVGGSLGDDAGTDENGQGFGGGDADTDYTFAVTLGGTGGTSGNGGSVTHTHGSGGAIVTSGDLADGLVLQSIGGAGGVGGSALAEGSEASADVDLRVGGKGGDGGVGGAVTLTMDGNGGGGIDTAGEIAHAVVLQSIGGGGGQGGDGSRRSHGTIHLGGNGNGASSNAETGGAVTLNGYHNLSTRGADSYGVIAQSIGGGGGIASVGNGLTQNGEMAHGIVAGGAQGSNASMNGGAVNVDFGSVLTTQGVRAHGIVAQSIGGGGGIVIARGHQNVSSIEVGGGYGDGQTVTVDFSSGSLTTAGGGSHGIVAQSIGGGGGLLGDPGFEDLDLTPDTGDVVDRPAGHGSGARVSVTSHGRISTSGRGAHGIVAQSIGGGGGLGGSLKGAWAGSTSAAGEGAGSASTVTVTVDAAISATGDDAMGVLAQSSGPDENGDVSVIVNAAVSGGVGSQGAGVTIAGGRKSGNQLVVNDGGSVSALGGVAVRYQGDTNDDYSGLTISTASLGRIDGSIVATYADGATIGSVPSQGTAASVASAATAARAAAAAAPAPVRVVNRGELTGASVYNADVINRGLLVIGDRLTREDLFVSGSFTQARRGETVAAVHFLKGDSDVLHVAGDATLGGRLTLEPQSVIGGVELEILRVSGTVTGMFDEVVSGLVVYDQRMTSRGGLRITATGQNFDDASLGLTPAQSRVARYLGEVFESGDAGYAAFFGDLEGEYSAGRYPDALTRLSPGASLAAAAASFELAQARFAPLFDCDRAAGALTGETGCLQMLGALRTLDQGGTGAAAGWDGSLWGVGFAGSTALSEDLSLGGALGWDSSSFDGDFGASSEGDTIYAALSATQNFGQLSLTAAAQASYGWFDVARVAGATPPGSRVGGEHDLLTLAARGRAAWTVERANWWFSPMVDLDLIWTAAGGYSETGAGKASLVVSDSDEAAAIATPAVEFGGRFDLGEGFGLGTWVRAGASVSTLDSFSTQARFGRAMPSIGGFKADVAVADVVGRLGAGLTVYGGETVEVDVRYDGAFGRGLSSHAGGLTARIRF
ncbi:autotransporter outer membrane beta-barrel domain-containing protein [Albimonas sp. CAU 1670]|uniref:autotransporter outer membrane beta-barrel domain-containing protein n=1 Tax=Albimonas sp. CAU 1670 TaxID=3032599 RepID=UPI0023DCB460|nr:autotransporter outer membrane beta-barrel domain-containing protein [Albimonas sp. CAU 1670]MDF2231484.1 autotransporter outer membrane beta-barrel domain-containing protein [Albimonas sp. CAU 1670]